MDNHTNLETELHRIGLQTDKKIETAVNKMKFELLHEISEIFEQVHVTQNTSSAKLIEYLKAMFNDKAYEAMLKWERNDPDN